MPFLRYVVYGYLNWGYITLDKAEYRSKIEEINSLAEAGQFREAAVVADEVDWKHVKSARTLCMIGEIYEADKRYVDSARILRYAYKRSASSKTVLYRLAELDIRNGEYDEAKRFINEFEQNSPNDTSRYILKYKLLRAEKAPLDDQIAVLRDYKDHEYTERWAYELAKLYKKNGQKEKCIEECDDMILWFSEGKYVTKAMELKMTLTTLTPAQQAAYDNRFRDEEPAVQTDSETEEEDSALTGLETVEKKILSADDEDEDLIPSISAAESISKMETAASTAIGKEIPETVSEDKKNKIGNVAGGIQKKLSHSIRAVFSGIRPSDEAEDEDEDMKIVPDRSERDVEPVVPAEEVPVENVAVPDESAEESAAAKPDSMKTAAAVSAVAAAAATAVAAAAATNGQAAADAGKAAGTSKEAAGKEAENAASDTVDLDKLFAETGSALAGEVASGTYVMADTLESDRDQAEADALKLRKETADGEEEPEEVKDPAREMLARETDESLGLTRELHLRDAIEEELSRRNAASGDQGDEAPRTPIRRPEEAARIAVAEAHGTTYNPDDAKNDELSGGALSELPEGEGVSDEELLAIYGGDEAVRRELLANENDIPEVPEEEKRDELRNLSDTEGAEGSSLIDSLMGEPGIFVPVPVEGRTLTEPEKKAMSYFASIPGIDYQVTSALADIHNNSGDKTSKSGNIAIMGRQGSGKTRLAEGLILITCMHLGIKAAKVGKIVADDFNKKDPAAVVGQMAGGFLIIEAAGSLTDDSVEKLNQAMEFRTDDLIVIIEDEKADIKQLLDKHPAFAEKFTSRITVPVFTNDELVTFARTYAKEEGYKFDEMATLALYTMIGDNQRDTEPMTVGKVRQLVDKAIERNSRKLFGKTTDKEDGRIVLMEKDFNF